MATGKRKKLPSWMQKLQRIKVGKDDLNMIKGDIIA